MRVLVTGGTGDLGRRLVPRLRERGHDVVVATRRPGPQDVAYALEEPPDLTGFDALVHLASDPIEPDRDVAAMGRLVEAAEAAGLPHLVFMSIVGIDHHPLPYYQAKLAQERSLEASGAPWSILRATQFHTFVPRLAVILTRGPLTIVPRGYRLQTIDGDAVADRLADLVDAGPSGRATDIGGPQVVDVAEALRRWSTDRDEGLSVVSVPVPGRLGRAVRDGLNLLGPDGDVIGSSYDEFAVARDGQPPA